MWALFQVLMNHTCDILSAVQYFFSFPGQDVLQLVVSTLPASSLSFFHSHTFKKKKKNPQTNKKTWHTQHGTVHVATADSTYLSLCQVQQNTGAQGSCEHLITSGFTQTGQYLGIPTDAPAEGNATPPSYWALSQKAGKKMLENSFHSSSTSRSACLDSHSPREHRTL